MPKILIVDDFGAMRLTLKSIIQYYFPHVEVFEAENGLEAIKIYKEELPDLITMDITMPEMDGISATKEIIRIDSNAKIIMVSSLGRGKTVREAIKAGAKSFILKPFIIGTVITEINKILNE